MFWYTLVVWDVTYAIVKVDVSEPNGVIKHYLILSEYAANLQSKYGKCIIKNPCSEMKGMQEKESIMDVRGR